MRLRLPHAPEVAAEGDDHLAIMRALKPPERLHDLATVGVGRSLSSFSPALTVGVLRCPLPALMPLWKSARSLLR
jgi:hypothetical protein